MMVWSLQCGSSSSSWKGVRNYYCSRFCIMNRSIDRNIVAHYCVILSGWLEVMNCSGVVINTLCCVCDVGRTSGRGEC